MKRKLVHKVFTAISVFGVLGVFICNWSCTQSSGTEKHQKNRNKVINVRDKVTKIEMEEMPVSDFADPYILGNCLIVSDYKSPDKLIHILDKHTFKYITSTGDKGEGPQEIANMGSIGINEADRVFYVTDHGKHEIFSFYLDSVLADPFYAPTERIKLDGMLSPVTYNYVNDTLSIGLFWKILSDADYTPVVARWNMKTGEIVPVKYLKHPEIERKRVSAAASVKNGLYVESYWHHDLITIGYLNGDFKCNIYGEKWDNKTSNSNVYFRDAVFCKDKIVVTYLGKRRLIKGANGITVDYPTKLMVFDLDGNYIQTLETGHPISHFYYDEEDNRLFLTLQDDMLLAYLDLDGII
ncbi:6-bladed beta-propeller [Parabacteroides bouchesdurhonensis]|uniref:6-bladed beta-propeller n=1 Tax=Parabacteroides bouchesdurhonensis TaxID=1936995 RepID=UPI000E4EC93F|nr:6-bladed beta-propeller [Parabacteroides bouchesdurhonensis]RHJ92109.1 6-bladed beta-propeller [Bacteroides sp. AM07-16]